MDMKNSLEITKLNTNDIIWSYLGQGFSIFYGILVIPLVVKTCTAEEVGFYYLMLTISSSVQLLDFGFCPQFAKNITYVLSGVSKIEREGIVPSENANRIDFKLLFSLFESAKFIYRRLAFILLMLLVCLGTIYIYNVTDGFKLVEKSLTIWMLFSLSLFFELLFRYYNAILLGRGFVKRLRQVQVASKLSNIILICFFLFLNLGLLGIVIANFIAPFIGRYIAHRFVYENGLAKNFREIQIKKDEMLNVCKTVWFNARKMGIVFLAALLITRVSLIISGLYLSLAEIGSYGLMIQLVGVVSILATTIVVINNPVFAALEVNGKNSDKINTLSSCIISYYAIYICLACILALTSNFVLGIIDSTVLLPSNGIILLYLLVIFLEGNHSAFSHYIASTNRVPFVLSSVIAGSAICVLSFIYLRFFEGGILGLVIIQGTVQLLYANWKWPRFVLKELDIGYWRFLSVGIKQHLNRMGIH